MILTLSSAAAPALDLVGLVDACARRGLAGVELVAGGEHGVRPGLADAKLEQIRRVAEGAGVRIVGYRAASAEEARSPEAARLSAILEAPVVAPRGALSHATLRDLAERYAAAGGTLCLAHSTDPQEADSLCTAVEAAGARVLGLCWEVRPTGDHLTAAGSVLDVAGPRLRSIRLYGGGPEAVSQTGQGIGALMGRLTLAAYRGPVVLTPSTSRYHHAWQNWIGRRGGWGCGSKTADATLVHINA
jgi:hypothetical protein